jgi:hypothetical protein
MFNAAGGGNTPRIDEGYYHVQSSGTSAHKFLYKQQKQETFVKLKIGKIVRLLKVKLLSIARSKAGVTLFVLTSTKAEI